MFASSKINVDLIKLRCSINKHTSCWLYGLGLTTAGYGRIGINRKSHYTHRLMFELVNGEIKNGLHILHKCDTPNCCNPDHLFLGTPLDNIRDMISKGRARYASLKGELNNAVKLKESQIVFILKSSETGKYLAKKYGVSPSMISLIRSRKKWRHVVL